MTSPAADGWTAERRAGLVALLPRLRAFARALAPGAGDDLLHDAVARALAAPPPHDGLSAWMFTILRNLAHNMVRRARIERAASETLQQQPPASVSSAETALAAGELQAALDALPIAYREALLLVGAHGFSYEEAARIVGKPVGTIKARVARARMSLHKRFGTTPAPTAANAGMPHGSQ
jgi:RNA polymerase sigma-70 factor (ECF subfamily)